MGRLDMSDLPEELLENILRHLDVEPPSKRNLRQEPSLNIVKSSHTPLKTASLVCKRWRRVSLPLLYKYSCLRLDIPWRQSWSSCPACSKESLLEWDENDSALSEVDQAHIELVKDNLARLRRRQTSIKPTGDSSRVAQQQQKELEPTAEWAKNFYHGLKDFCDFVRAYKVESSIRSFTALTDGQLQSQTGQRWRYEAICVFWRHLYSIIQPERIVIVAPPHDLIILMNASAVDEWREQSGQDEGLHLLELRCEVEQPKKTTARPLDLEHDGDFEPDEPAGFATCSLIHLQPWTHVALNEGSFLGAYGTLEYFERGPPTAVYSIRHSLMAPISRPPGRAAPLVLLPFLRSLTYIGIFPFASDLHITTWFPDLEELDVQFAPNPNSKILHDKKRVGRAELADCWQELTQAYRQIAVSINTFNMSRKRFPRLKGVTCRDFQIPVLIDELDEIFTYCCLPVWVEYERGVYTRGAMSSHEQWHEWLR